MLDGGLAHQLEAQGCDLSDALWSARLLADDPAQIERAHAAYVRAGAQVLITASYQASYEGFARRGLDRRQVDALLRRSVHLARRAAAESAEAAGGAGRTGTGVGAGTGADAGGVWVAGGVGPYGAMLADGSEYRGQYGLSVRELAAFHRPRIAALAGARPDVLALETVPDIDEAEAMLWAAEDCGVPVWLSYSVKGRFTRSGQPLERAFALAADNDQVIAVGVNCSTPADAEAAVRLAALVAGKPVVLYPNSGEEWDATVGDWQGRATFDAARVGAWQRDGARLVGGCCRVGPDRIAELAAAVRAEGRQHGRERG
ncbi:homocysteine S-methyltransferase [Streptomyces zagrosensis]|uniref:Homocysteine S-methyltransferase n=1 Tax=Streptomyces zagrosensis TaxID=1042984 RepID=A0A7W9QGN4_9ACTN|nr:homocysteine S-methyltransferase [Streptomyces zagrosensis]